MDWIHLVACVVATALFGYLTVAMIWPEKF